jgi:hypothetical protein
MKNRSLLILLLLLAATGAARAQDARNGTNAAAQLLVPLDAHYLGGGGAAALATGMEGVLWNPAGLDRGDGAALVMVSHRNYIADIGINFAGVGYRFGALGALALHLRSFDLGQIERTDEFHMDGTGETYSPTFFALGATYGRQMTDRISIGVTTNLVYENFVNVGGSAMTFDAGVQYQDFLSLTGLRIGVAIRNIGTAMQYDGSALYRDAQATDGDRAPTKYQLLAADADMPTVVDIGASYRALPALNVSMTYTENTYGPSELRAMAEYDFLGYLDVRGAYLFSMESEGALESIYDGVALGASLHLQPVMGMDLTFDYGFMPVKYFAANHLFTLRGAF